MAPIREHRNDKLPNIFEYASKELSQDAMICYLIHWSGVHADTDEEHELRRLGGEFVSALLSKHGRSLSRNIEKVEIFQQDLGIDVLAQVHEENGTQHVLLIEDKTNTKDHSNQLIRYCDAVRSGETGVGKVQTWWPIYLKTGNHSLRHAREIEDKTSVDQRPGYKVFNRRDFLSVLNSYRGNDPLAIQFRSYLRKRDREFDAWKKWKLEKRENWSWDSWEGFYSTLENEMAKNNGRRAPEAPDWGYVPNPRGGFLGFWWFPCGWDERFTFYLQTEVVTEDPQRQKLCFKVEAGKESRTAADYWHLIQEAAKRKSSEIERPPRLRSGTSMTVGWWSGDWLAFDDDGHPDVSLTFSNLCHAAEILELARKLDVHP